MSEEKAKVDDETLEADFARFLSAMRLTEKCDAKQMDPEDEKAFRDHKRVIFSAMRCGQLVVDDKGQPVFTPEESDQEIVFRRPRGDVVMAMDQAKREQGTRRSALALAALTGTNEKTFTKMFETDLRVCGALLSLFLA